MPIAITAKIIGTQGISITKISSSLKIHANANNNKITASTGNFLFTILYYKSRACKVLLPFALALSQALSSSS